MRILPLVLLALGLATVRTHHVPTDAQQVARVMQRARLSPVAATREGVRLSVTTPWLDPVRAVDGVLLTDGGRLHLALQGPLGGVGARLVSDGYGLALTLPAERRHVVATDAEAVLRRALGGPAGVRALVAAVRGELALPAASVRRAEVLGDGSVVVDLDGPDRTTLRAWLTPDGVAVRQRWEAPGGRALLDVERAAGQVVLRAPPAELVVRLHVEDRARAELPPEAFTLRPPDGFRLELAEEVLASAVARSLAVLASDPGASDTLTAVEVR